MYNTPIKTTIRERHSALVKTSHEAECKAIEKALEIVIERNLPGDIVVVNSDCQSALQHFMQQKRLYEGHLRKPLILKKVKGHTRGHDPRHWVNNWCDANAKQARIALETRHLRKGERFD